MPPPATPRTAIDFKSIAFPSDRVTVADLRRAHPERFDAEGGDLFEPAASGRCFYLELILFMERLLARAAFEEALGDSGGILGTRGLDRDGCVEELTEYYRLYRVADGRHATEELVRGIESQAAAQAGKSR